MQFAQIITIVRSATALKTFVEGGALVVALKEIGGVETEAAILCLDNAKRASNPKREIELAV
jgi:hypothetical protein